ncbi:uncharacterized protein [Magallana gigas]|uniref:uncharacterized protein n=1 Tax=Magallana gigas TaxID=29159 RepID=UPI00333E6880
MPQILQRNLTAVYLGMQRIFQRNLTAVYLGMPRILQRNLTAVYPGMPLILQRNLTAVYLGMPQIFQRNLTALYTMILLVMMLSFLFRIPMILKSDYSPSEDTDQGSSDTDDNAVCSLLHLKDSSNPSDYVSDSNDSEKSIDVPISIPFETRGSSDTDDNAVHSLLHLKDLSNPPDYVSDSNDSERSIVVPISIPLEIITVQKTNTEKGKQKWDKKHACKFCGKLYPKLARHLETMHKNEVIVAKALSLPKNSAERKEIWKTIRNEGDWDHNFNVLKNGTGTLIPKYREQKTRAHSEFIPCIGCKGLYSKTSLSDHFKTCVSKQTDKKNQGVKEGRFLLPIPEHINGGFYKDVLLSMSQDDIYMYIYRDPLILKFGKRLYENKDIQEHTSNHISCRMRELGRLIGEAKKTPEWGIQKIEDCFSPEKFNNVVSCVKSLAGFSEDTHMYATPSLALKIGYSLQRCARIYRSDGIIESDITKQENGSAFIQLYESDWNDLISSRARQTLSEKKYNAPKMLPLCEDVYKLNSYLKEKIKELLMKLSNDSAFYIELAKMTLCHITLFNRKRGGDVQRITVDNYKQAIEAQNSVPYDDELKSSLSDVEIELCRSLTRIELKGKQERKVAILLTPEMIKCIDLLMQKRSDANVCGKYLFARPSPSTRTLRASDVLNEICGKIELRYGNIITYTNLRKHIATMAQIHELSENGQDQLAKFLGHDIRVHREIYRQPLDIIQKTKISKMLMLINEGKNVTEMLFNNQEEVKEIDGSCADESDGEMAYQTDKDSLHNKSAQGKRKAPSDGRSTDENSAGKRHKTQKKPWNPSEMNSVNKHFSHFIAMSKVPGKNDIENVLKKDKILSKRTWRNVKDQVYNLIKKLLSLFTLIMK